MADTRELPVFAYIEEAKQLQEIREYLNKNEKVKLEPKGPEDISVNLVQICETLHLLPAWAPDVDLILNSICSLIVIVPAEKSEAVVTAFIKSVSPQHYKGIGWGSHAGHAVRVLSNLFRGYSNFKKIQEMTFKALVNMCAESRLIGELACDMETLSEQFAAWQTPVEGQREILRSVHRALIVDQRADQAARIMTFLLGTYTETDAAKARPDALECVRTAVVDPKSFSFDHLERLTAVKALKQSDPLMFSALELFVSGTLKDYQEFVKKNPKFVEEHLRVDEALLLKKIRLLTLMSLAEQKNEINLDELGKQLDIPADETLEEFVIDAIQVNAISGKINEMSRTLVVNSYQHRRFGQDQWVVLQKRLMNLISNLKRTHANVNDVNRKIEAL